MRQRKRMNMGTTVILLYQPKAGLVLLFIKPNQIHVTGHHNHLGHLIALSILSSFHRNVCNRCHGSLQLSVFICQC